MPGESLVYPGSVFSLTNHEVFVITAKDGEQESGFVATWLMPATLVPDLPRVVAVFSPMNYTFELIRKSGRFVANMLAEDQYEWLPLFGLNSGRDRNKFEGIALERSPSGLPVLPGTCGWSECLTVNSMDSGDRVILLADVVESFVELGKKPLRKYDAFAKQPPGIALKLIAKHRHDGKRDRNFIKRFREI